MMRKSKEGKCMKAMDQLYRFFIRFRYPVSMPEDIATALGLDISNYVTFDQFVNLITHPTCKPTRISKYMPREKAEEAFRGAQCKDRFKRSTLFSFYFSEGWLEFTLEYDEQSLLRRVYVNHKQIKQDRGVELTLTKDSHFCIPPVKLHPRKSTL
jgi:hypothetical protein